MGCSADDGRLGRSWKDGRAVGPGRARGLTHLADGLLALYEATFDERWFTTARDLMDRVLEHFADPAGGFFDTADDHERLITRPKDLQDNAMPSGDAMAASVLLRLAALTGEGRYRTAAERAIRTVAPFAERYPTAFAQWLSAIDFALSDAVEVAIVGDPATLPPGRCSNRSRPATARTRCWPWRRTRKGAPSRSCTTAQPSAGRRPPTCAAGSPAACR